MEDHETGPVDRWPDDVLKDDHPTLKESDCISTASAETIAVSGYYASLSDIWL